MDETHIARLVQALRDPLAIQAEAGVGMRPLMLLVLVFTLMPAAASQAAERVVISDRLALHVGSGGFDEAGGFDYVHIRIGFGKEATHVFFGAFNVDEAVNEEGYIEYDLHEYTVYPEDLPLPRPYVFQYGQRGLIAAHFRYLDKRACLDFSNDGGCDHTVAIRVRLEGYGPITTVEDPDTEPGIHRTVTATSIRAATVTGTLLIDGVSLPGGDLSLGEGHLSRVTEYTA